MSKPGALLPKGVMLGTWAFGGNLGHGSWGPQDETLSRQTIHLALDADIRWFDTAPVYGDGLCERILGDVLAGVPYPGFVAGKCGLLPSPGKDRPRACLRPASIRDEVEKCLRRLRREYLDLCQIHWPHPAEELEEGWETLVQLRREGKINAIGVCNFTQQTLERLQAVHPIDTAQFSYNLIERSGRQALFSYCQSKGISVIAYAPLRAGLLTGRMNSAKLASLDSGDWRVREKDFREPMFGVNRALVCELEKLAESLSCSMPALALAWVLGNPAVDAVILGARSPGQLAESLRGAELSLSKGIMQSIDRLLEQRDAAARALR